MHLIGCHKEFSQMLSSGRYTWLYSACLIMGKGNSPNFKIGWDRGVSVQGLFNLDYLHPFKPLLFRKFSNFSTFILGGHFLLPQRANFGKGEFIQLQNCLIHIWSWKTKSKDTCSLPLLSLHPLSCYCQLCFRPQLSVSDFREGQVVPVCH